jgi:hypothetical protein
MGNNLRAASRMAPTYRARDQPSYLIARHGRGVGMSVACRPNGGAAGPLGLNSRVRLLGHSGQATEWQVLAESCLSALERT